MIPKMSAVKGVLLLTLIVTTAQVRTAIAAESVGSTETERPWEVIEVAVALDTSNSMGPLIEAARLKLWRLVSDLARLEPAPRLRVGLITYGSELADWETGWVRLQADLTSDLDWVSERLFSFTESGGGEYVGRALRMAIEDLSWSDSDETLRLIFVAGNERADQDPEVSFRDMAELARERGITIYGIFCGDADNPDAETWKELSELSKTDFSAIDLGAGTKVVETPFDEEMSLLSDSLSKTYIPLGAKGESLKKNLIQQDRNAAEMGVSVAADRALVKTTALYSQPWDLVAATEAGRISLDAVEETDLPEALRAMTPEERAVHMEEMRVLREDIEQRLVELAAERRQYLDAEMAAQGLDQSVTFDAVVRRAVLEEAESRGFDYPDAE